MNKIHHHHNPKMRNATAMGQRIARIRQSIQRLTICAVFEGDWSDGGNGHGVGDDDIIDPRFPGQVMSAAITTMGMEARNRLVDFFFVFLYLHFPLPALSVCNLSTGSHPKALLASREILPLLPPNICLPMIIVVYIQQVLNSMPTLRSYKCRGIATFEQI